MMHAGSCHCGAVAFEVEGEIREVYDCNCTLCRRRGGLLWFRPATAFRLTAGAEALATYTFHKHVIRHRFCRTCGIATHGEGAAGDGHPMVAVNVRCLPEVDLENLSVRKFDGLSF